MDDNMVMVPVPQHLVTDVYRFIVTKEESRAEARGKEEDGSVTLQPEAWRYSYSWSEDDLRDALENGTRAVKLILPYLAKHPNQAVKGQVLAELVYGQGATTQQLGGALSSFTKTAGKRYGRYKWPFKPIQNNEDRTWEYIMYSDTAEKVSKLANA